MVSFGIASRLSRLAGRSGRFFFLALDHGLPAGPLPGIEDPRKFLSRMRGSPVSAIIANPGLLGLVADGVPASVGRIVHLSAGTLLGSHPRSKIPSATVAHAVALGGDAVSVQVHFGEPAEDRMLAHAGAVTEEAQRLGVPAILMVHPPPDWATDPEALRHAARAAAELGSQVVQTPYLGPPSAFREVVRGCPVPLVVAGGPEASTAAAFLSAMRDAMAAGAAGISVGRNLFRHPDPAGLAAQLGDIVFGPLPREALV